ncbi:MAG: sugar dehydrogenase complex small subunit [Chitinophagaceae bacterium]
MNAQATSFINPTEKFYHLSNLVTGFDDLPANISDGYYAKMSVADGYKDHLETLLTLAENISSAEELMQLASDDQKACCKAIVFLWYAAELISFESAHTNDLDKKRLNASEEEYYSGLIWRAIRAHPLALSGGYYGYWKYEPEN